MVKLKGSGASFPFPLYGRWFKEYGKVNKHVQVDYQAKGSGAGIKDFVNKTVDFAASDAAMTDEEIAAVDVGVQLLPMTAGEIVLAYNLPNGPKDLKLRVRRTPKSFWVRSPNGMTRSLLKPIPAQPYLTLLLRWCAVLTAVARPLCLPST